MAFNASGTDYRGFQSSRDRAQEATTRALDAKGKADKQARIKKSGERSGLQKLVSAGVRGAAAYYSGGLSEQYGGGEMIDSAMLGTDSQGNAVQNEYGQLVGVASKVGGAMSAQKGAEAAKKLEMQSQKDSAMQTRLDNLDPTGQLGMEFALKKETRDSGNLKALQAGKKGSFGGLVQRDIEGLNYEPTSIGDWETKVEENKIGFAPPKPSTVYAPVEGKGGLGSTQITSAALQSGTMGLPDEVQKENEQEQNSLIRRLTAGR
jgi:hypothetical protein